MRKVLFVAFVVMAFVAVSAFTAAACGGQACGTSAKSTTAKSASSDVKTTDKLVSSTTSSKSSCSMGSNAAACAYKNSKISASLASAKADHAKVCNYGANCQMTSMSITGMTCGGCENGIKSALMKIDGVNKVVKVSYETGLALVCVDPAKASNETLMKAVSSSGFEAAIIPAVATVTTDSKTSKVNSSAKACCSAKKSTTTKASAKGTN